MHTTKTLYLVRHAKSCWKNSALGDRERPLNKRGQRNLPIMADRLAAHVAQDDDHFPQPQIIISSPAERALTTAKGIARQLDFLPASITLDERLYFQGADAMLKVIRQRNDFSNALMLVGHNPGMTELYNRLCPIEIERIPTCAVITLLFNMESWQDLKEGSGHLVDFDFPKKEVATDV